jgi:hypothetical protein
MDLEHTEQRLQKLPLRWQQLLQPLLQQRQLLQQLLRHNQGYLYLGN